MTYKLYIGSDVILTGVQLESLARIMEKHASPADVKILPYAGKVFLETRKLQYRGSGTTRIISYGDCNLSCPWCKRDCQFLDAEGVVIGTVDVPLADVARAMVSAVSRAEVVRFSGSDPVSYKRQTAVLLEWLYTNTGVRGSIAHNGTWGASIAKIAPYLECAAVDLKGTPENIGRISGVRISAGESLYTQSLKTQRTLMDNKVEVDCRTPVFGTTTMEQMVQMGRDLTKNLRDGDKFFWTWRTYKPIGIETGFSKPDVDTVVKMMEVVSAMVPFKLGLRAKWASGGMVFFQNGTMATGTVDDREADGTGNSVL